MNRRPVAPATPSGDACAKHPGISLKESVSLAPVRHRPIRVALFVDRRRSGGIQPGRPSPRFDEIASRHLQDRLPVDRVLITRLVTGALRRAGYCILQQPLEPAARRPAALTPVLLEGHIWSVEFQVTPAPLLDIDLSLALCDPGTQEILWRKDLPSDDALPFWIGLGCKPDEMVPAALEELEEAAFVLFRSESFSEAIRAETPLSKALPSDAGGSHKVVAATSWTGTEEGEITATAHESGAAASTADTAAGHVHGADQVRLDQEPVEIP